ncbi:hypothetical protein JOE64_002526 [Microbacterium dextranolyticum]|nr:hypothetical protein [Microbacterium dextranolyticum]
MRPIATPGCDAGPSARRDRYRSRPRDAAGAPGIPADDVEITTSTTEGGATTQAPVAYDAAACR